MAKHKRGNESTKDMKKSGPKDIIKTYKEKIKFICPNRGPVEQEVEVKVYTPISAPNPTFTSEEIAELLEQFDLEPEGF